MDGAGGKLSVLVVEDDEDTSDVLALLLRMSGHDVRTAATGTAALDSAREYPPDVALVDIGLQGMSGHEVARRLHVSARGKRPFLIALTGYGQAEDRRKSEKAGIDLHLVKPVDSEQLLRMLARFRDIIAP